MKNLAICLSGSLRSIEHCYNNFIEKILEPNINDYNIYLFYCIPNDSNIDKIKIITYNKTIIKIIDDIELPKINVNWGGNPSTCIKDANSTGGIKGFLYQLQNLQESYLMVMEFEKKNNIKFDIIMRSRHDIYFKEKLLLKNYYVEDKIFVPLFHSYYGINDRFAFGSANVMSIYMNSYTNIYNQKYEGVNIGNAEYFMKLNLLNNNINFEILKNILFNRVRIDGSMLKDCF